MQKQITKQTESNSSLCDILTIKEEKKKFEEMTLTEKRVAIAEDVIRQIEMLEIIARCSVYLNITTKNTDRGHLSELMQKDEIDSCRCCAKGALFMGYFNLNKEKKRSEDPVVINDMNFSPDQFEAPLRGIFSKHQWNLIESAFEASDFMQGKGDAGRAIAFGNKHRGESRRMIAIMENIIENDGIFMP